jgi:hypothetical protein
MRAKVYGLIFCCLLLTAGGCEQSGTTPPPGGNSQAASAPPAANSSAGAAKATSDACALVEKSEVEAVQGERVAETKPSRQSDGNFLVSQCYYVAASPAKSVVLSAYHADPNNSAGRQPKDFWAERFAEAEGGRDAEKRDAGGRKEGQGREEKEESSPPRPVEGLGDGAFWLDNRMGGALYVLKGNAFLRISVGGPGDTPDRIKKSKALAQKALERL